MCVLITQFKNSFDSICKSNVDIKTSAKHEDSEQGFILVASLTLGKRKLLNEFLRWIIFFLVIYSNRLNFIKLSAMKMRQTLHNRRHLYKECQVVFPEVVSISPNFWNARKRKEKQY